jgi:hypothetical protein
MVSQTKTQSHQPEWAFCFLKCPTLCQGQIALDKVPSKYTRNVLVMLSLKEKNLMNP